MPEILATRKFRSRFLRCLSRHPNHLRIVSPFLSEIPGFGKLFDFMRFFLREEGRDVQVVTLPPCANTPGRLSRSEADSLVALGVNFIVRKTPPLHSKVYQFSFDGAILEAFVGSANFTKGGFQRNDETVAYFTDADTNGKIEEEINRLAGPGSVPLNLWKLQANRLN